MTTKKNPDVEALTAEPESVVLSNGQKVLINRLKTRETLKLLKILTNGASGAIGNLLMAFNDENTDESRFIGELLGAVLVAFPDAEDETIDFLQSMVTPADLVASPKTKPEHGANEEKWVRLIEHLSNNPELDDTITIVEKVVTAEAPHIKALGNRLALLLKVQTSSAVAKQSASSKNGSGN